MPFDPLSFDFPEFDCAFEFADDKPIFRIIAQTGSGTLEVTPTDFARIERNDSGIIKLGFTGCTLDAARGLKVRITLRRDEPEVIGQIEVEPGGVLIREVRFPHIVWQSVLPFDALMMSTSWGDNIERPTKTIRERCGGELTYVYPSMLAMQYMALHNPGRCVYLSNYSLSDESFFLGAKTINDGSLALSVNHQPFAESATWRSPECGFAVLPGGWHAAADLYGSHMRDKFKTPDVPQWMRDDFHGWVQVGMRYGEGVDYLRFTDLPGIFRRIREVGLNTMHVYGWSGHGFDTEYPDYDINPHLGTEDELRSAMDEIAAMGGHAILYINGRLVDPDTAFYKQKGGDRLLCLQEDGKPYIECYGTGIDFRIACPVCEPYQDQIVSEVAKIVRDFHAGALQIDQISCNPGFLCFDKNHSHPTPATNFLPGVSRMLARVRETHKAINPDFFVWCEGCHEKFGQFYDVNQGHGEEFTWQIGESTPEQFKYNYPDSIVTGISDGVQKLCHTYAQGKPFDFHLPNLDNPGFVALLKQLVAVRKANPEYFLHGVFRDNVGVETSSGARVFAIEREDGRGTLVNVWVPGTSPNGPTAASVRLKRPRSSCRTVYPSGISSRQNGDWLELTWDGPVATLIFE